jgi:hypothetical protein
MVHRRERERSLFEVLLPDGHKLWLFVDLCANPFASISRSPAVPSPLKLIQRRMCSRNCRSSLSRS